MTLEGNSIAIVSPENAIFCKMAAKIVEKVIEI